MKNRVKLNIAGYESVILSEESDGYIRSVGAEVDSKIRNVMKHNSDISTVMAAIVSAMDFCDMYRKAVENIKSLEGRVKEYLETAANSQVTAVALSSENEELRKRIADLEIRLRAVNIQKECPKESKL